MNSKVTIIRSQNKSLGEGIHEFWEYRELLYMLMLRRITVRYKQTVIGIAWVLIQPLVSMTIFSIIFGNLVKIPSDGVPYPVFVYGFGWSTVSAIAIFSLGTWIFRSAEEGFADYI